MERLVQYIEQLQLAGVFLHEKGRQHARLSLILCDNVVELLAHERCNHYLLSEPPPWIAPPKLKGTDKADARGQDFAPKLNLLARLGDIEGDERDFATRAHTLRNECYHTAAMHEEVSWQVAWDYHELACSLFGRLRQGGYSYGGPVPKSEAAAKVLEQAGFVGGRFPVKLDAALAQLPMILRALKPPSSEPLRKVLSRAAKLRITGLMDAITFLANDGHEKMSEDEAIRQSFFRAVINHDELKHGIDVQSRVGFVELLRRYDEAKSKYVSPVRFAQVRGWLNRAEKLASAKTPAKAMVCYMDILRESEDSDTFIHEAASDLDAGHQLAIDEARGK